MAEEAAHLTLSQCAACVGVLVAREQVHTKVLKDTAVECPVRKTEGKCVTTLYPEGPRLYVLERITQEPGLKEDPAL